MRPLSGKPTGRAALPRCAEGHPGGCPPACRRAEEHPTETRGVPRGPLHGLQTWLRFPGGSHEKALENRRVFQTLVAQKEAKSM